MTQHPFRLFRRNDPATGQPTGPWHVHVYDPSGKRHVRSTHQFDYRAAINVARELEREFSDPRRVSGKATLDDALKLLIDNRTEQAGAGKRSAATVTFYKQRAEVLRRVLRGDLRLALLTATVVDEFISRRRAAPVTESTIHKELVTLRAALKLCKRAGTWGGDLDALLPPRFSPGYQPRERWLPRDELRALCDALKPDRAAFVCFCVATGARLGEARRARREDIARDGSTVRLRGTKTKASERVVPIVGRDGRELLCVVLANAQGADGALFTEWKGIHQALRRACKKANIAPCSPNDLRRSYATWLRRAGALPATIAPTMGHRDSTMVDRVYGRVSPRDLAEQLRAQIGADA